MTNWGLGISIYLDQLVIRSISNLFLFLFFLQLSCQNIYYFFVSVKPAGLADSVGHFGFATMRTRNQPELVEG